MKKTILAILFLMQAGCLGLQPPKTCVEAVARGPAVSSAHTGVHQSVFNTSVYEMTAEIVGARFLGDVWQACGLCYGEPVKIAVKASPAWYGENWLLDDVRPCRYGPGEEADFFFIREGMDREAEIKTIFWEDGRRIGYDMCRLYVSSHSHRYQADVCEVRPRFFRE